MTKHIVIIGGGTGGTMLANKLAHTKRKDLRITLIEKEKNHLYQPGLLFLPFGLVADASLTKPVANFLSSRITHTQGQIQRVDPQARLIYLESGEELSYDVLVIASGVHPSPEEVPGMHGALWYKAIYDFYTLKGARALREQLETMKKGRLVVHVTEMPIKCPIAPLEFVCLAHDFFTKRNIRDQVSITYVIPLSEVFTKPTAGNVFKDFLAERGVEVLTDFATEHIDEERRVLVSYDGKEVSFDTLVTVPPNLGSAYVRESGLGDELNLVPTDKHTLQSKAHRDIFVLGDASDIPTSKAGSSTHYQTDVIAKNIVSFLDEKPLSEIYDGHANCFLEVGNGKAAMLDFNYTTEPLFGTFPLPIVGPFSLLRVSRVNHWGKRIFSFIYWHFLLKDRPLPLLSGPMRMWGKVRKKDE